MSDAKELLDKGAGRSGRSLDDFQISPSVQVRIDDNIERARDAMRPFLALYVGGMGSREKNFYNALVRRYGFEDAADEVQSPTWKARRRRPPPRCPTS